MESNDDLLEGDGDLIDEDFELDGADEDALLADDYEELQVGNKLQRSNSIRSQDCIGNYRDMNDDEDIIELGIAEEELGLTEDDKSEILSKSNGDQLKKSGTASPIIFTDKTDSDEEEREKERSRFKTERDITIRTRTTIPETLEGVLIKRGGGTVRAANRGQSRGGGGGGGGNPGGGAHRGRGGGGPSKRGQAPRQPPRPHHTSTIHVNPHFRPRPPIVPGWQGNNNPPNNFAPQQFQQQPQYNNYTPPPKPPQWSEPIQNSNYYPEPMYQQNYQENYYNGPPQDPNYYQHQQQQPPPPPPPPPIQHQNMMPQYQQVSSWEQQNYYPIEQQQQMPPPQMDMYIPNQPPMDQQPMQQHYPPRHHQNQMRPQFQRQNHHFGGMKRGGMGGGGIGGMRGRREGKVLTRRTERKVVRNLHQVQTVDNLPSFTVHVEQEEEDEEMKEYRLKIEEQKKLREQVLRMKEEKRAEAIQQRQQLSGEDEQDLTQEIPGAASTAKPQVNNPVVGDTGQVANVAAPKNDNELRAVRVRTKDGKTVLKKLPVSMIMKLKKVQPERKDGSPLKQIQKEVSGNKRLVETSMNGTVPNMQITSIQKETKMVRIDNLSATTTKNQLLAMARQVGVVQSLELENERGRASIRFEKPASAPLFLHKFQRKMVDLSMITISLVSE